MYAVNGTPADCVYLALKRLLPRKPDILFSGLNHGPNLGQQDIAYSGTVAGALQGAFLQIPSVAVSMIPDLSGHYFFDLSANIAAKLAEKMLETSIHPEVALNINIPPPPLKGFKITKLGQKKYNPEIISKNDPRQKTYYWIGTGTPEAIGDSDSDVMVVKEGYVSVTPLHRDLTDFNSIKQPKFMKIFASIKDEIS